MNEKLSAGIVGGGFIGQMHAEVLSSHPNISGVTIYESASSRRDELRQQFNVTETLQQLLNAQPDIVIVAVPPSSNLAVIQETFAHAHRPAALLIDKPLAISLSEAEKIERLTRETDSLTMIGLTGRFHPEFVAAAAYIHSGVIGEIQSVQEKIHIASPDLNVAKYCGDEFGGIVVINGIHSLDHLRFVVQMRSIQVETTAMDNENFHLKYPDHATAKVSSGPIAADLDWLWTNSYTTSYDDYQLTIVGSSGRIVVSGFDRIEVITREGKETKSFHAPSTTIAQRHFPGLRAEHATFIDAILNQNKVSPVPLSEGVILQQLITDLHQQANWTLPD